MYVKQGQIQGGGALSKFFAQVIFTLYNIKISLRDVKPYNQKDHTANIHALLEPFSEIQSQFIPTYVYTRVDKTHAHRCTHTYARTHTYTHTYTNVYTRDVAIHNLDISIYCHLCITIQRYIAQYNQV